MSRHVDNSALMCIWTAFIHAYEASAVRQCNHNNAKHSFLGSVCKLFFVSLITTINRLLDPNNKFNSSYWYSQLTRRDCFTFASHLDVWWFASSSRQGAICHISYQSPKDSPKLSTNVNTMQTSYEYQFLSLVKTLTRNRIRVCY